MSQLNPLAPPIGVIPSVKSASRLSSKPRRVRYEVFLSKRTEYPGMGIVADIGRSDISFATALVPSQRDTLNFMTRQVAFDMHSFTITFAIAFDPNPRNGIGGDPKEPDLWRIGIVQNVMFQHAYIEYENKKVFQKAWRDPALDYVDGSFSKPFFGDPDLASGRLTQRPVADIWYTSTGYGELLNPNTTSGVSTNNMPSTFNIWDEPSGGTALRNQGAMIKRLEKVISFQTWLVAKTKVANKGAITDKIEVLAHIPVFSLVFWLQTAMPKNPPNNSMYTPPFTWGMFGANGIFDPARINRKVTHFDAVPTVAPKSGSGGSMPVMLGVSANERANAFLTANALQ